jgi:cellulose synthase/poly-beta-1,6-N-acetylglucosamine synthase-like glycosyltransferase
MEHLVAGRRTVSLNHLVLIPAHNESQTIGYAVRSVLSDASDVTVVVVADNCTDDTAAVATVNGAEVFVSRGNTSKKAGALNQALRHYLPQMPSDGSVLVLDADTILLPGFTTSARQRLSEPAVGAVSGLFLGDPGGGILEEFQRNEYARYARQTVRRRRNESFVLSGTSTIFRVQTLRDISEGRASGSLPSNPGEPTPTFYDEVVLTEDNHITLAVKTLGYRCSSPKECVVQTEVMPTTPLLWKQRMRWQRGALENLTQFGFNRVTFPYWRQQLGQAAGILLVLLYLITATVGLASSNWSVSWFWMAVGCIFFAERIVTAFRRVGWRGRLLSATVIPEFVFDSFLMVVFVKSFADIILKKKRNW